MGDRRPFQKHFCSMPAFGRQFQLGDLYDYRTHCVIKDEKLSWSPAALALATQVDHTKEFKTNLYRNYDCNDYCNRDLFLLSLDNHTRLSITAGLIELNGASSYMYHRPDPGEDTITFSLSVNSKESYLDLKTLVDQGIPSFPVPVENENSSPEIVVEEISDATHIVVGVFYGAEAHCVLTREKDGTPPYRAYQNMSKMAKKFLDAVSINKLNVTNFKNQLSSSEKHLISQLKCRLYLDLQTELVHECDFFDAYSRCHNLVDHLKKTDDSKCVPIAIQLCPLKILFASASKYVSQMFGECPSIDDNLVRSCGFLFSRLEGTMKEAEEMCASVNLEAKRSTLRQFLSYVSAVYEFKKSILKKSLFPRKSNTDHDSTIDWVEELETFPHCFNSFELDNWLWYKHSELVMEELIIRSAGTAFLPDSSKLEEKLREKKYALVLKISRLDDITLRVLKKMKFYIDKGEKLFVDEDDDYDPRRLRPWHLPLSAERNQVLDLVRHFGNYVEKNQLISNQVLFCLTYNENHYDCLSSYLVFEDGNFLTRIAGLPGPPTRLRVYHPARNANVAKKGKATFSSMCVEWYYGNLSYFLSGYPYNFLVEYRLKGTSESGNSWSQKRTTEPDQRKVTIYLEIGSTLEIRVAAETCVGRSDFSQVIDSDSAVEEVYEVDDEFSCCSKVKKNVLPPSGATTTSITIDQVELKWSPPPGVLCCLRYRVIYWKKSEDPSSPKEKETGFDVTSCCLENLEHDSTYLFIIVAIADDHCKTISEPSEPGEFSTKKKLIQFAADKFVKRCTKIGEENGLHLYSVPRTRVIELLTADRYVIDTDCGMTDPDNSSPVNGKHRSILFVGDSNCGKTSLINDMVNYILEVDKKDPFRFQLIDPCPAGRVEKVNVYDIRHEGFRIPYSVTIIDTPSYVDYGPSKNKKTTRSIQKFIDDQNGVHQIDTVCFVMDSTDPHLTPSQLYIYCSLMKIFGTDIKNNVEFLFTCCDSEDSLPLLTNITKAGLVPSSGDPRFYKIPTVSSCSNDGWMLGFFSSLATTTTKSVSLWKRMPDERRRLETTVNGLEMLLEKNVAEFEQLLIFVENLARDTDGYFIVEEAVEQKVRLPFGQFVTNCQKCQISCHLLCGIRNSKLDCDVMDPSMPAASRTCRVCKCSWEVHSNDSYKWAHWKERRNYRNTRIKEDYERKLNKTLTPEELMEELGAELLTKAKHLVDIFDNVLHNIKLWKHVAMRLHAPHSKQCRQVVNNIIKLMSNVLREFKPPEERLKIDDKEVEGKLFELLEIAKRMCCDISNVPNRPSESDEDDDEGDEEGEKQRAEVGEGDA